jgi:hypothetical protein
VPARRGIVKADFAGARRTSLSALPILRLLAHRRALLGGIPLGLGKPRWV